MDLCVFRLYRDMNLLGGSSRFTPCATVCMLILFCVCHDLYHVVVLICGEYSFQLSRRDSHARNGARHHVRI